MMGKTTLVKNPGRICVVTAGGQSPAIIINALGDAFGRLDVVIENSEPKWAFLKRRARKVGWANLAGQFLTMTFIVQMKRLFPGAIHKLVTQEGLQLKIEPRHQIHDVDSVNAPGFVAIMDSLAPDLILLCGCRMIKAEVLSRLRPPVLNYHAGITPLYRGMNGGYWALASGDEENFGTTVHLVDAGVDTGSVIAQIRGKPRRGDSIWTYAYYQAAISRNMCVESVRAVLEGKAVPINITGASVQHYHPEFWKYLWNGVTRGVW